MMKLDRPDDSEIERIKKTFVLNSFEYEPNVSLQELFLHFQELAGKQVDLLGVGSEYIKETNHIY